MGWHPTPPPPISIFNVPMIPVSEWKKTFIIWPRKINGRRLFFKFVYRKEYMDLYRGHFEYRYVETIFDILRDGKN